jgi:hypothetical protein
MIFRIFGEFLGFWGFYGIFLENISGVIGFFLVLSEKVSEFGQPSALE